MKWIEILLMIKIFNFNVLNIASEDPSKNNQISNVNPDGSFQFAYQTNDHYHQSGGNPITKVRGRYGSKNPSTGKIDETVYTAGSRGYRAKGPNIHRKQNLSQVPRSPIGSPDDPLADPYDDPSYKFQFKTKTHSRREEANSSGKVQGQYIYVDDVGEKHGVNYKAGANTGFEVENGVPDSPSNVRYNIPLYKSEPTARGRITFERGPDRQYKFLTSSPDQRRAETTGPDGITRGSYSYLDDKGIQRTVEYIAGAGIGYKVVQSTVGPGTHVSANSAVPEYSVKAVSNEIAVTEEQEIDEDYHTGPSGQGPSGPSGQGYISSTPSTTLGNPHSTASPFSSSPRPFSRPNQESVFVTTPSSIGGLNPYGSPTPATFPSGGPSPLAPSGPTGSGEHDLIYGLLPPKEEEFYPNHFLPPSPTPLNTNVIHITPPPVTPTVFYPAPTYLPTAQSPSSFSYPQPTQAIDYHHHNQEHNQHENHQEQQRFPHPYPSPSPYPSSYPSQSPIHPGDGVVKNTSSGWFYGIPSGSALRAHIQNIDLVPIHDRALSPSEALQLDEERDAHNHRRPHPRV